MSNHLKGQLSPYLIQHSENPVDWYPWCDEAFRKAKSEDKPIFLSIGYSTCHWCHVMAHESFESSDTAEILNKYFISIKVDKEERPDIDNIYMAVCQAFTGSGGWPTSIFMTPDQEPFFAGTYFPRESGAYGTVSFKELLEAIHTAWESNRDDLFRSAEQIVSHLNSKKRSAHSNAAADSGLIGSAVNIYKKSYDKEFGGFGSAPKFPAPHNLLFLMTYYEKHGDKDTLEMAEKTLVQMYKGGLFDHIGYGFCRYSTDRFFLVPHFEKMLYDNALLILAYCKAYRITGKHIYLHIAEKTATYILREMTAPEGGFCCAQDADSDGVEGKYYLFTPSEIIGLLGEDAGKAFNEYYGISRHGNFEGQNIPNLLHGKASEEGIKNVRKVYEYRRQRNSLRLDDKILTSWNSLTISAMCMLYRISSKKIYLDAAANAERFITERLCDGDALFAVYRRGVRGQNGFLDDYAYYIYALLSLYESTLDIIYLKKAETFCGKTITAFYDKKYSGFYFSTSVGEKLIINPKETYDGALPSGNSVMAYNLVRLSLITGADHYYDIAKKQLDFMYAEARQYPVGYSMFLIALSDYFNPPPKITAVLSKKDDLNKISLTPPHDTILTVLTAPTADYPLLNEKTTFYVCKGRSCLPPVNDLREIPL